MHDRVAIMGWASTLAAIASIPVADALVHAADEPSDPTVVLATTAWAVAAALLLLGGAVLLLGGVKSSRRPVFPCRPLRVATFAFATVATVLIYRLVAQPPFGPLLATGHPRADDVHDAGCVALAFVALVATAIGIGRTWRSFRVERAWPEWLGRPH